MVKFGFKSLVAASLISLTTSAYAGIACPDMDSVKAAADSLNAVIRVTPKMYFVLTAQPAVQASNLNWMVAAQSKATGFDAAYNAGQSSVNSVIALVTEEAIEQAGMYLCAYMTSSSGMNVIAAAPQQQGFAFNPATINLEKLKK